MKYDLLIKGATVIAPSQSLNTRRDVALSEGKVVALETDIPTTGASRTVDVSGLIVTPGLVDLHAHVYWGASALSVDPDQMWARSGTTTIVDAGSAGAHNFAAFRRFIIEPSPCRILAFLHISAIGITGVPLATEALQIRYCNVAEAVRTVEENRDVIVGIKVRASGDAVGENGLAPLELALAAAERVGLPLMVHVSYSPSVLADILPLMRKGDILTHCYTNLGDTNLGDNILDGRDNVRDIVWEARERGVLFDIGHGSGSLSYQVARAALAQGFKPDSISTDFHSLNLVRPVRDLPTTMSKFLNLGMGLEEVVARATVRPAEMIGWGARLGTLQVGAVGDLAAFELQDGEFPLYDSCGEVMMGRQRLVPVYTVRAGRLMEVQRQP